MRLRRIWLFLLYLMLTGVFLTAVAGVIIYIKLSPQLPSIDDLRDVQLQQPLRIYSRDRKLLAEFGEKRRTPVSIDEVPPLMIKAFLAAEDDSFAEELPAEVEQLETQLEQLELSSLLGGPHDQAGAL